MKTTSLSLLDRLKATSPSDSDWLRLQEIYLPYLKYWLARVPGLGDEASDVAQEVFIVLVRELPRFERQRDGSFRAWLRQVVVNKIRTRNKQHGRRAFLLSAEANEFLNELSDSEAHLSRQWDVDHDRHVFEKLLAIVRPDFSEASWEAFRRFAIDGHPAAQVAQELGLSENAVIQAKSRILKRLRKEAGEFLE